MLTPTTKTVYAAARGDQLLSDGYPTPDQAIQQVKHLNEQMQTLGFAPEVQVVKVEVTTTVGAPTPYTDTTLTTSTTTNPQDIADAVAKTLKKR